VAVFSPASAKEGCEVVAWAVSEEQPLELAGGGSKRGLGRPMQVSNLLDLSRLSGIASYEPAELVLTAATGTPLEEIEAELAARQQMLASNRSIGARCSARRSAGRRSAASFPATSRARGGSRRGRRVTTCSASTRSTAAARRSRPAARW